MEHINRFGESHVKPARNTSHDPEAPDWSHDPRSESLSEFHSESSEIKKISDDTLMDNVRVALYLSPEMDARNVEVSVHEGVVTLTGLVKDRAAKMSAERCVEEVPKVKDIVNLLELKH